MTNCLCNRYHSLAPMYYRGAQAAIVVYDIQNQDSFQRAKTWVKELQRQVIILHGNAVAIQQKSSLLIELHLFALSMPLLGC